MILFPRRIGRRKSAPDTWRTTRRSFLRRAL
jgi:hypothetical protein